MKWRTIALAFCLCAVSACFPAHVLSKEKEKDNQQSNQETSRRMQSNRDRSDAQRMIERYDENDDGALERSELPRNMQSDLSRLDRNEDGKLSASELRDHARQMRRSVVPVEVVCIWVSDVDQGRLSINDLQNAYDTLNDIDENNDGKISKNELQQRRNELASKWVKQVVSRLDENDDGSIDEDEAEDSFLARRFDQFDTNGNGKISRQELKSTLTSNQGENRDQTRSARRSDDQTR